MQKITSIEHAQEVLGTSVDFEKFNTIGLPQKDVQPLIDSYKLWLIFEANNKLNNWEPDWNDRSQSKYSVWKEISADPIKPSGFGFSHSHYGRWNTLTIVGARLVVGSSKEALYIGKEFEPLFESAWLIIKPQEQQ